MVDGAGQGGPFEAKGADITEEGWNAASRRVRCPPSIQPFTSCLRGLGELLSLENVSSLDLTF